MTATSPNFVLLDSTRPDIAILVVAMLQARDAVGRRSWSHSSRNSAVQRSAPACVIVKNWQNKTRGRNTEPYPC
jgi:hypothetical protein